MSDTLNTFLSAMASDDVNKPTEVKSEAGLVKLEGNDSKKGEGAWVFTSQGVAADQGFRNVSKIWYTKTLSYADGMELLEKDRAATEDIQATVAEMVPTVNANGAFAFLHRPTERYFVPTEHAMGQVGNWADTGTWYVQTLLESQVLDVTGKKVKYTRDRQDAETLAAVIRNGFRRLDQGKKFFWRTRNDGSMRAMLTNRFAVVDNRWLMEQFSRIVPGGRLSHWKGDGDTLYGNILIPDTIREDKDSDYGGMLSIGNSEIGVRRVSSVPSIFRAICMNGCIWGATKGKGIGQVHRGKVNLTDLAMEIESNLKIQIPLLPQGIERLLALRNYGWDGAEMKPLIATVASQFKLAKKQASAVYDAFIVEQRTAPEFARSLFGVTNAITRAGQTFDRPADWVKFDEIGGKLTEYDADDYVSLSKRAKAMTVKDVEECFA